MSSLLHMSITKVASPICEDFVDPPTPARVDSGYFAFANIQGAVNLVRGVCPLLSFLNPELK